MSDVTTTDLQRFDAPYRREILLQEASFESGMRLIRLRIREGHRFTLLDLDAPTARAVAAAMVVWCDGLEGEDGTLPGAGSAAAGTGDT
ncbi:MAG: hypothetical protein NW217_11610 [Hyphomicrobiaceae bacterium]|nr:hypothetical protein [Hyphomicrobiaceae bacterium]